MRRKTVISQCIFDKLPGNIKHWEREEGGGGGKEFKIVPLLLRLKTG